MPEMDCVTLAREIRKRMQTLLILLSSSGEMIVGEDADLFHIQTQAHPALLFVQRFGRHRSDGIKTAAKKGREKDRQRHGDQTSATNFAGRG